MAIFWGFVVYCMLFLTYAYEFVGDRIISQGFHKDIVIYHGNCKFTLRALVDTGNRLVDKESGAPVCIISLTVFLAMFPLDLPDGYFISYSTIAGVKQKIFVFAPEKIEVVGGRVTDNVRLGVAMNSLGNTPKYEALLNMGVL